MSRQSLRHEVLASDTLTLGRHSQLGTSSSSWTCSKIHCPVCLMKVFIVNGFFVTEEVTATLWLRDVVHLSCSHSHFMSLCPDHGNDSKSGAWGSMRPFYHHQISRAECQRIISGWHGGNAWLNNHPALRRRRLAINACQADWGVKPTDCPRSLPQQQACIECNHFGVFHSEEDTSC